MRADTNLFFYIFLRIKTQLPGYPRSASKAMSGNPSGLGHDCDRTLALATISFELKAMQGKERENFRY